MLQLCNHGYAESVEELTVVEIPQGVTSDQALTIMLCLSSRRCSLCSRCCSAPLSSSGATASGLCPRMRPCCTFLLWLRSPRTGQRAHATRWLMSLQRGLRCSFFKRSFAPLNVFRMGCFCLVRCFSAPLGSVLGAANRPCKPK